MAAFTPPENTVSRLRTRFVWSAQLRTLPLTNPANAFQIPQNRPPGVNSHRYMAGESLQRLAQAGHHHHG